MTKQMLRRVRFVFIAVIVVFVLLSARLAYLQILRHDYYWYRSEMNRFTKITLPAPRGEIYDRDGKLLVSNRPGFVVSLMDMGEGYDPETVSLLSEILDIEEEEIYSAIEGRQYMRYLPLQLKSDLTPDIIARIAENRWKLKGVNIDVQPIREYREGSVAAHVLGYLGRGTVGESTQELWAEAGYQYQVGDLVGQDGVERTWEPVLRGKDGEQRIETNNLGQPINYFEKTEPIPGNNLYLTLDLDLQKVAEKALEKRVKALQKEGNKYAGRAAAVVMDTRTGAIRAMANYPSFDPNNISENYEELAKDPLRPLSNTSIQGTYPVGSTFKMVTAAAALEEKKISDRDVYRCNGVITLYNDTKSCFNNRAHGRVNFYSAMAVSCNIYFYQVGLAAGIDNLARYAAELGLGVPTGLTDLHGEAQGTIASREYKEKVTGGEMWYPAETMSAAIGQSYNSFTPLQLAVYTSILANGGTHYRPYLVDKVVDYQGKVVHQTQPEALRKVNVSSRTLSIIREGMRRVTQPGGTAYYYFSRLPVSVAGKTGSAQVAALSSGIPAHSLFVGFAPVENPEIAVAVIVEHGGIGATGAVPVAAEIMQYYFTGSTGDSAAEEEGGSEEEARDELEEVEEEREELDEGREEAGRLEEE
ncbi:MAG: penicillin-binding protein 2 [Dethiobacteria bacterium]|nr:penicillin-binding protein 2 [Bacillota bacterium]HOP69664.1 penicillin-binding protein 2 [Bacillota bacterium]HPT34553.1 penicillin-binding protein 2 [Bacillota bacterium]HPZ64546.1 penicillin-binding protein 2 [Bacillota bacterium]HQD06533.1 penicillin-binding protein 2 [Bacillota bacterium]